MCAYEGKVNIFRKIKSLESTLSSQSTSCCSLRLRSLPVAMKLAPSIAPVVLKAQHDPHTPNMYSNKYNRNNIDWPCSCILNSKVLLSQFQIVIRIMINEIMNKCRKIKPQQYRIAKNYNHKSICSNNIMITEHNLKP